jgi:hypothetical protein
MDLVKTTNLINLKLLYISDLLNLRQPTKLVISDNLLLSYNAWN